MLQRFKWTPLFIKNRQLPFNLFVVLLLFFNTAFGQSYIDDFSAIFDANYHADKIISCDIHFRYYAEPGNAKAIDSLSGVFTLYKNEFYYRLNDQEFLKNDKYYLVVNHEQKSIMIGDKSQATYPQFDVRLLGDLVRSNYLTIQPLSGKNGEQGYRITRSQAAVENIELWFRTKDHLITKLIMDFKSGAQVNTKPRVVITYSNYKLHPPEEAEAIFSEKGFFSEINGKPVITDKLKGYVLLNYRQ